MAYNYQQSGIGMQQGVPSGHQNVHQNNGQQQGIGMQQQHGQNNNVHYQQGGIIQYQGNGQYPQQGLLQGQHDVLPNNIQYQGGMVQYQGDMQRLPQGQQNGQNNNDQQLGGIVQYQGGQGLLQGQYNDQNNNIQNQGGMQQGVVAPGHNVQHINGQYTQQGLLQGPQNGQYTVQPYGMSMQPVPLVPVPQNVRQNNNGQQPELMGMSLQQNNRSNNVVVGGNNLSSISSSGDATVITGFSVLITKNSTITFTGKDTITINNCDIHTTNNNTTTSGQSGAGAPSSSPAATDQGYGGASHVENEKMDSKLNHDNSGTLQKEVDWSNLSNVSDQLLKDLKDPETRALWEGMHTNPEWQEQMKLELEKKRGTEFQQYDAEAKEAFVKTMEENHPGYINSVKSILGLKGNRK